MKNTLLSIVDTVYEKVVDEIKIEMQRDTKIQEKLEGNSTGSYVAKSRSQIFSFMREIEPKIGSILAVGLGFGVIEHTGIYVGKGYVIEQHGDDALKKVTLQEFMDGDGKFYARGLNIGIQIACDSVGKPLARKYIAENAKNMYEDYERKIKEYSVVFNNCHQFCWECVEPQSDKSLVMFATLEEYVAKHYGCMLYWDGVKI